MSAVCNTANLDPAWELLRKASAMLEAIHKPMNEGGMQAALGTTLEIADNFISEAMEMVRRFPRELEPA